MAKTLTKSYQLLGSASTSTYSQLRLYGKYNSQNEATLKSNITLQLRLYGNGGSGSFSSGTARINSSSSSLGSTSYTKGKETTLKTLTYDVQHDSNGNYSCVQADQVEWYKEASEALEKQAGAKVPSLAFQHIVVGEVYDAMFPSIPFEIPYIVETYNNGIHYPIIAPNVKHFTLNT